MSEVAELLARCDNVVPGHGPRRGVHEQLQSIAAALEADPQYRGATREADNYGRGEYLSAFEGELAARFGKDAAVFLPSGTMAQQIALRIWCERQRNFCVAMHPTAHLEIAEHLGYQHLHGIKRLQFGAPEAVARRPLTVADLQALAIKPAALLIELPYRPLGGVVPEWSALVAISEWARTSGVALHMDGARVWQCADHYGRTHAEIAALFDSVYVSFYKDVGAIGGAALLGEKGFIDEARIWQRRHGGNLFTLMPYVASARTRLQMALPLLPRFNARAREIAQCLSACPGVRVQPNPPHVNFFEIYFEADAEALVRRHHALARECGTFLFSSLWSSSVPGISGTELHCWENALSCDLARLSEFVTRLMSSDR